MNEHPASELDLDHELRALVRADPTSSTRPDLPALRAGGRRRLVRRRLALGAGALAVAAVIAVPLAVVGLGEDDGRAVEAPVATPPPTPSPTPAPTPAPGPTTSASASLVESERIPISGGRFITGLWNDGPFLGGQVRVGVYEGFEKVVYASATEDGTPCVSLGLRVEGRILQLLCAVNPGDPATQRPERPERFVMWGGAREEADQDTAAGGPHYLLIGVVPGDTDVSIAAEGETPRPVSTTSTGVLPGYTVFVDTAPWDDAWDPLQLAPLTVTTGSGLTLDVPRRSYVS